MHEMSLTESLVEIALEEATKQGATRITRVRLDVGKLSHIEPEALVFCFEAVTKGTAADGALLEIDHTEGTGWCLDCAREVALTARFASCPLCGRYHVQMTAGDEFKIRELEVV